MEKNLDKEVSRTAIPDTYLEGKLSSLHLLFDHEQYWLLRSVMDHNIGEVVPDFPHAEMQAENKTQPVSISSYFSPSALASSGKVSLSCRATSSALDLN